MLETMQEVEQRLTEIGAIISITRKVDREENWEDIAVLMDLAEDLAHETRIKVSCTLADEFSTQSGRATV